MAEGKICVFCREDCSNRPRVKDPEGRYACRAYAERNVAPAKPVVPAKRPATPGLIEPLAVEAPIKLEPDGFGELHLSDLATEAGARDTNTCPG